MAGENSAAYSGPLSPEEVAECDREMEEMARQNRERLARRIDERIERSIERSIERGIERSIERGIERGFDDGMSEAIDRRRRFEARERIRRARAEGRLGEVTASQGTSSAHMGGRHDGGRE